MWGSVLEGAAAAKNWRAPLTGCIAQASRRLVECKAQTERLSFGTSCVAEKVRFEPKAPDVARFTSDGFSNEY